MSDATQLPPLDPVGEDLELLTHDLPEIYQKSMVAAFKHGRWLGRAEMLEAVKAIHRLGATMSGDCARMRTCCCTFRACQMGDRRCAGRTESATDACGCAKCVRARRN